MATARWRSLRASKFLAEIFAVIVLVEILAGIFVLCGTLCGSLSLWVLNSREGV